MPSSQIIFITTCKGRTPHLRKTLPINMANNPGDNCRFLVLDYGDDGELEEYLKTVQLPNIESGRLIVYRHDTVGHFRMSHAKNMAHRCAMLEGADILVNMDADNFTPVPGFADSIMETMGAHQHTFMYCNAKSIVGRARQGLAGRIAVHRNTFLEVGGYDESYIVWAPEDEDFKSRLRRLGREGVIIDARFLFVIPHKDGLRFKEYPHAKPTPEDEAKSIQEIHEADHVIANHGNIGCGIVYRNFDTNPIDLRPLPTRIFGVGMQKTGTTSLHEAFRILRFDSAHWKGPWWAKRVYEEMTTHGHSRTVEDHYAMSDNPFTILFRELDKGYPGSKFILTIRDEKGWLESVRKHWEVNSVVYDWDRDCFSHKMHTLVYGRKTFDSGVMLNRYRRHNEEVIEYFKHRPHDLLVMDINKAKWGPICEFLGVEVPSVPFPHEFKSPTAVDLGTLLDPANCFNPPREPMQQIADRVGREIIERLEADDDITVNRRSLSTAQVVAMILLAILTIILFVLTKGPHL